MKDLASGEGGKHFSSPLYLSWAKVAKTMLQKNRPDSNGNLNPTKLVFNNISGQILTTMNRYIAHTFRSDIKQSFIEVYCVRAQLHYTLFVL